MTSANPIPPAARRKRLAILLTVVSVLLFGLLLAQTSFDLPFINPANNQQIVFLVALSAVVFFLFVTLSFVLARDLIKVFAEPGLGVLRSNFPTRLWVANPLPLFFPVIVVFS